MPQVLIGLPLLGDTLHNVVADALTAVTLGIAFWLGRQAATRAYTYGFGRAEGRRIRTVAATPSPIPAYVAPHGGRTNQGL